MKITRSTQNRSTRALRLGTAGASIVVSAALLFGNSAWAPTDVYVEGSLAAQAGATASGHRDGEPHRTTGILYWPAGGANARSDRSPAAGTPCATSSMSSTSTLSTRAKTSKVINAAGDWRSCY